MKIYLRLENSRYYLVVAPSRGRAFPFYPLSLYD